MEQNVGNSIVTVTACLHITCNIHVPSLLVTKISSGSRLCFGQRRPRISPIVVSFLYTAAVSANFTHASGVPEVFADNLPTIL